MNGRFHGKVVAEWLTHPGPDRDMELVEPFAYTDPDGLTWDVPAGAKINGASIPRGLWIWGSPYVGNYRLASVVHDHYCFVRTRPHKATHRMFRDACITGGVNSFTANKMYSAVRLGGPKWDEDGNLLDYRMTENAEIESKFREMLEMIEKENPDFAVVEQRLEQIEAQLGAPEK